MNNCILCGKCFTGYSNCDNHPVLLRYLFDLPKCIIIFEEKQSKKWLCAWDNSNLNRCVIANGHSFNGQYFDLNLLDFKTDFESNLEKLRLLILFK